MMVDNSGGFVQEIGDAILDDVFKEMTKKLWPFK
jgi:hypothetical protein